MASAALLPGMQAGRSRGGWPAFAYGGAVPVAVERRVCVWGVSLPDGPAAQVLRSLDMLLAPWLAAAQRAHLRRFVQGVRNPAAWRAGLSRRLARALLLAAAGELPGGAPPELGMDAAGRPRLDGMQAAFSHSGRAAFCAVARGARPRAARDAGDALSGPSLALDAESVDALPPAGRAFAPGELPAGRAGVPCGDDRLRRWVVKEALCKATGLGLALDPALVPAGLAGQRAGLWRGPAGDFAWRCLPGPGHWLCVALPCGEGGPGLETVRVRVRWLSWPELLRRLRPEDTGRQGRA